MKLLARTLFALFLLLGVLIAVSNSQPVQLALWPLPQLAVVPLYLLVIALLLLGVLAGLGLGWWAARHHRRRARKHGREVERLDREVKRLREAMAQSAPPRSPGAAKASDSMPARLEQQGQKAIERQHALVASGMSPPVARTPRS